MDRILKAVSDKLGTTPEKLKNALDSGDLSQAITNMPKKDAERLNAVLNNPALIKQIVNSKAAQEIKRELDKK